MNAACARRTAVRNARAASLRQQMVEAIAAGDDGARFRARTALFEMFEVLSFRIVARVMAGRPWDCDDLRQECRVAVIQAIDAWDPARGEFPVMLTYYVRLRVRRHLRNSEMIRRGQDKFDQYGRETREGREGSDAAPVKVLSFSPTRESFNAVAGPDSGESSIDYCYPDSDDSYGRIQDRTAVAQALAYLPEPERHCVCLRFGLEGCQSHSYRDLAPLLGCSYMTAKNRVDRALPILAAVLEGSQ